MSPWWSRPTADDLPEDYDPEEDEDFEPEASNDTGEESNGSGPERRRRRKRRTRTSRQDSEPQDKQDKPQPAKSQPAKSQPAKQAAPSPSQDDDEDQTPAKGVSGRRRRRRRAASADSDKEADEKKTEAKKPAPRKQAAPKSTPKADAKADKREAKKPEPKYAEAKRDDAKRERKTEERRSEPATELAFEGTPAEVAELSREIDLSASNRSQAVNDERKIALFCDLENIALGVRDSSEVNKFDIHLVLERLLEKGKIIVKKAYCDWERYSDYKRAFHEAGIEMIDIPQKYYAGKNSADIKMVVDSMDLSYSKEHLDTFVVLSGDSDFSPLVSKLKENNKYVIGVGVKNSSSNLLVNNCDEFIYYEDIWRDTQTTPQLDGLDSKTAKAFQLMVDSIQALLRENKDVLWGSMIKQTMQRKKPSFNEGYYGYGSFSELLEDAEKKNILRLKKDKRSGSYIVTGFA